MSYPDETDDRDRESSEEVNPDSPEGRDALDAWARRNYESDEPEPGED